MEKTELSTPLTIRSLTSPIHNRINGRSHMFGTQRFKAFIHVTHVMETIHKPLLKLPAIAFIMPIRSTTQILAGRRSKI